MKKDNLKKLKRIPLEGWLGGVAAGIAYFLKFPLWIVRLVWILIFFFGFFGPAVVLYVLLWIFMPKEESDPKDFDQAVN